MKLPIGGNSTPSATLARVIILRQLCALFWKIRPAQPIQFRHCRAIRAICLGAVIPRGLEARHRLGSLMMEQRVFAREVVRFADLPLLLIPVRSLHDLIGCHLS